ncbi:MAG TPA: HAD family phosphatase [Myxococcales bacterium]
MNTPTVLFDLGNVLVRLDLPRGLSHLRRLAGRRAPQTLESAELHFGEASTACNRGDLSPEAFIAELARQLGAPASPTTHSSLVEAWCDIFEPWPEMEALADEVLQAGHAAYLASNTDPLHFAFLELQMPVLRRLTGLHLSYEARVMKPDPAFFTGLLARFGLRAADCVYLDDRAEHVEAARSVGIRAAIHEGEVAKARAFLCEAGVRIRRG